MTVPKKDDSTAAAAVAAAVEAYERGFTPLAIRAGDKKPFAVAWPQTVWTDVEQVRSAFTGWAAQGVTNVGLLLGERGHRLADVDLDHPLAVRLARSLLPKTAMMSGRRSRPRSHYWYVVEGENGVNPMPDYRKYMLPPVLEPGADKPSQRVVVELRSTHSQQTVIPPSVHTSGEPYEWVGREWGGKSGPTRIDGRHLARMVATLAMVANLLENWPGKGQRHDAYLAMAGGFLRFGDGIHPYWEKNLPDLIRVLAHETRDDDGPDARVAEVIGTTVALLRKRAAGDETVKVVGFGRLAEIIGNEHADLVKRYKGDIEALMDYKPEPIRREGVLVAPDAVDPDRVTSGLLPEIRNPMEERVSTWDRVDMEPYIAGRVVMPDPNVLVREDGKGLMYPGRVNSLYGLSESGKSWIALVACQQEMVKGGRVMYLDFEDSPEGMWDRMRRIGVGADDMSQFAYVHPEDPLADMMRGRFGPGIEDGHKARSTQFKALLESFDPTLVVVDGMTTLYNAHGLDTNAAGDTDVIGSWLKSLARNGRSTVIVIDHTGKGGQRGDSPIGAHHKVAMVQGTALQVIPIDQPMPGAVGRVELMVYKDRPGAVRVISGPIRRNSRTQTASIVVIDSSEDGLTRMRLEVPDPNEEIVDADEAVLEKAARRAERMRAEAEWNRRLRLMREQVLLKAYGGEVGREMSKNEVAAALADAGVEYEDDLLDTAMKAMVDDAWLLQLGHGRGTRYALTEKPGEQE